MGDVTPASWLLVCGGHEVLVGLVGRDTTSGSLRCHLVDRRMAGDESGGPASQVDGLPGAEGW